MTIDEIAGVASDHLSKDYRFVAPINALAQITGVHHSTVCGWRRNAAQQVPVHHARTISKLLGIPLHEIRPDVWPPRGRRSRSRNRELTATS
jgi:DNA-binding transcriptional regulator YdaS (Cro superfamily)